MNASPLPHVAVVLAAGGSRRLGQPKQLLKRDGETLVHRAVRLALETKPQRVLLVVGGHAQAMRDAVADLDVEVVMNTGWEEGLASSVRVAAAALAGDHRATHQPLAIDHDRVVLGQLGADARALAVDGHLAGGDQAVGLAARTQAEFGDELVEAHGGRGR